MAVKEVVFEYTQLDDTGRLMGTGDTFTPCWPTQVFKAIGQTFVPSDSLGAADVLELAGDRIAVNDDRMTSIEGGGGVGYAGGDCVPGTDLTVAAVEDGKRAAEAIHRALTA